MEQKKNRHKWDEFKNAPGKGVEKCVNCGLYRFTAIVHKSYSYKDPFYIHGTPFFDAQIKNPGCKIKT